MLWLNLLHLYQPANIERDKLLEATEKSYERILRALEEHPGVKFTLNIAGCLLVRWDEELGRRDLIERFKRLLDQGRIELTGSAAYHALLPLVSKNEAKKQITDQEKILRKYFGARLKLQGFFLPELAYSRDIAKTIKNLGYRWLILDELSAAAKPLAGKRYSDSVSGLDIIFRNRKISESFVPETILPLTESSRTVVTCSDAELYGLRHLDQPASFERVLKRRGLVTQTISSYIDATESAGKIKLHESSWQTSAAELRKHMPFALWYNKNNALHDKLWRLAGLAQKLYWQNLNDKNRWWSRWHLVRGLASCTFWWASHHDFRQVFGPLAWNPDEIERGADELIRSIRSLEASTGLKTKKQAEELAATIKRDIWLKHWQIKNRAGL